MFLRNSVWLLSNLCRVRDGVPTNFEVVKVCLPTMLEFLTCGVDELVTDACWCFAFLTDSNRSNCDV